MFAFRLCTTTALVLGLTAAAPPLTLAQPKSAPAPITIATPDQLADVQEQLITLLRMSPTLVQVVETDPALLADQSYVARSNPQLAQFLEEHPEVTRNPDFYLFSNVGGERGRHIETLHRVGWPPPFSQNNLRREYILDLSVFLGFAAAVGALLWLIRVLLENRRWSRAFRRQTEIHSKLIDRCATAQELLEYMNTEPGRRFLEASPIPVGLDRNVPLPGSMSRVMGTLQLGVVLTMLGLGMLILKHSLPDYRAPFLLAGMVTLMPGLGFIISSIVTWRLGAHLELTPPTSENGL